MRQLALRYGAIIAIGAAVWSYDNLIGAGGFFGTPVDAASSTSPATRARDAALYYGTDDPALRGAQETARQYYRKFLRDVVGEDGLSADTAQVKVAIPITVDGVETVEVVWVGPFGQLSEDSFAGVLKSPPEKIVGRDAGDLVLFSEAQIRDWSLIGRGGKVYGSYTTRAMLADLDADHRAQISAILSEDPLPPTW